MVPINQTLIQAKLTSVKQISQAQTSFRQINQAPIKAQIILFPKISQIIALALRVTPPHNIRAMTPAQLPPVWIARIKLINQATFRALLIVLAHTRPALL